MELRTLTLTGYRRFSDETKVQLNGKMVSLVGPNEAGKTSVLTALDYFSHPGSIHPGDKSYRFDGETKLVLSFFLERDEWLAAGLENPTWFEVHKSAQGSFSYNCKPRPSRDVRKRKDCAEVLQRIIRNKDVVRLINNSSEGFTFDDMISVQSLLATNIDEFSDEEKEQISKFNSEFEDFITDEMPKYVQSLDSSLEELSQFEETHNPFQSAINILAEMVPSILFFGEEDRNLEVPYQIALYDHTDPKVRKLPSKPLNELIKLSGLNLTELIKANKQQNLAIKAGLLEDANLKLKELSKGIWTQSDAHLYFTLESGNLDILVKHNEGFETKDKYNNFKDRSDGYKQFIALQVFAFLEKADGAILLVDEIEQHLHYDAQADLIQLLAKEKSIGKVIYTTHSAGSLPEDLGAGIRLVKWDDDDKRKSRVINKFWYQGDGTGFAPLLFGMGATTLSFFPTRNALIGEGPTELLLLPKMLRESLDLENLEFQVVHGLSSINPTGIPTVDAMTNGTAFIVDNDDGGDVLRRGLLEAGVPNDRIVNIGNPDTVTTIEDLLDADIWIQAVNKYIDDYSDNLPGIEKLENAPLRGRIEALPEPLNKQKISFSYNILEMIEKDPTLKIVAQAHRAQMRRVGQTVRTLFEIE